jgi:hypothetical protein
VNSIEKLAQLQAELGEQPPEGEGTARMAQVASSLLPYVGPMLPEDPAELDGLLLWLAAQVLARRSDDAPRYVICELDGPPPPDTHVIVLRTQEAEGGRVDIHGVRFEALAAEPGQPGQEAA